MVGGKNSIKLSNLDTELGYEVCKISNFCKAL